MWVEIVEHAKTEIAAHLAQPLRVDVPPATLECILVVADAESLRMVVTERVAMRVCGYFGCASAVRGNAEDGAREVFCSSGCAELQQGLFARCRAVPPDSSRVVEAICALFPKIGAATNLLARSTSDPVCVREKEAAADASSLSSFATSPLVPKPGHPAPLRIRLSPGADALGAIWGLSCPQLVAFIQHRLHRESVDDCKWLTKEANWEPVVVGDAAVAPAAHDWRRRVFVEQLLAELPLVTVLAKVANGNELRRWIIDVCATASFDVPVNVQQREARVVVVLVLFLTMALCDRHALREYRLSEAAITCVFDALQVKMSTVTVMLTSLVVG